MQQFVQLTFVEAAGFVVVLRLCLPFALLGGEDFLFYISVNFNRKFMCHFQFSRTRADVFINIKNNADGRTCQKEPIFDL